MRTNERKKVACAALLALSAACYTKTGVPPVATCGGLGESCSAGCCAGFTCEATTQLCLLIDVDGGACQADLGDCTTYPNWCCSGLYCDPLVTSCTTATDATGAACAIQGGDCSTVACCADLACDPDAGTCVNTYQALGGACTAAVQCGGTPTSQGTAPAVCDPTASICCIDVGNDCSGNPASCCTGTYCDPVPNVCATAALADGGTCSVPTGACAQDSDCCPHLACDTDAGSCVGPAACLGTGTDCSDSPSGCCPGYYCVPFESVCALAAEPDGGICAAPGVGCATDADCCALLVCDSQAFACTGCESSTQGCPPANGDGGVDAGPDAGPDAGIDAGPDDAGIDAGATDAGDSGT